MSFLDDFSKTISDKGKEVAQKAKDFAEVNRLNAEVRDQQARMNKAFEAIGRRYYEQNRDNPDIPYAGEVEIIRDAATIIGELYARIRLIKNVEVCAKCHAELAVGSAFCGNCGAPARDGESGEDAP